MHRHGAHFLDATSARFALWAPNARSVSVMLEQQPPIELLPEDDGWFTGVAACQAGDQALIQAAARAAVEVFQAGVGIFELGLLAQPYQALVVTPGQFAVEQQAEALIEAQAVAGRQRPLLFQGAGHAVQA